MMEFLLDTSDLTAIKKYLGIIPLSGVTTNPSIIKKGGKVNFFAHLRKIREILGTQGTFHVQVVGTTTNQMLADAHAIRDKVGEDVYIKIPTNEAGLAAMKILKKEDFKITATAIYTTFQGYLAIEAGADYLAPYYNRMVNMNIDAAHVIAALSKQIAVSHVGTKVLAASFHTVEQVDSSIENGAQAVTMGPDILAKGLGLSMISGAVNDFTQDWKSIYGDTTIANLDA